MKISTVEEMRNLDKSAIENFGIPQEFLMENAGEAVYFVNLPKSYGTPEQEVEMKISTVEEMRNLDKTIDWLKK